MASPLTHHDLVIRAIHWLEKSRRCSVVMWGKGSCCNEEPDAIGWLAGGRSILIECKATRRDFQKDHAKWHRKLTGVGNERWYLTPPDLVRPDEVPPKWGLLYCDPARLRRIVAPVLRPKPDRRGEVQLLVYYNRGRGAIHERLLVPQCVGVAAVGGGESAPVLEVDRVEPAPTGPDGVQVPA